MPTFAFFDIAMNSNGTLLAAVTSMQWEPKAGLLMSGRSESSPVIEA